MAENKTVATDSSVRDFLDTVDDERKRQDDEQKTRNLEALNPLGRHTKILLSHIVVRLATAPEPYRSRHSPGGGSSVTIPFSNIVGGNDTYR